MGCPFWETQFFIGGNRLVFLNIDVRWYLMSQKMIRHSMKIIRADFNEFEFTELNPKTILWFDKWLNLKVHVKKWLIYKTDQGGPWFSRDCFRPAGSCSFSQDRGLFHCHLLTTTAAVEWSKHYIRFSVHNCGTSLFFQLVFFQFHLELYNFSIFPTTLSNFN